MKTKVGDLLNFIADKPLSQFDWHIALLHHLNQNVAPEQKVEGAATGREVMTQLFYRGTESAQILMNCYFNTDDGSFSANDDVPTMPTEKKKTTEALHTSTYVWTPQKVIIIAIAVLITGVVLTFSFIGGRNMDAGQERVVEQAIRTLGDIAKSQSQTESSEPTSNQTPQEAPQEPSSK